jgi:hypothetical protein
VLFSRYFLTEKSKLEFIVLLIPEYQNSQWRLFVGFQLVPFT